MSLTAKLSEISLDEQFGVLAEVLLDAASKADTQFFVFGSTALIARQSSPRRLPGDIDLGVAIGGLDRLSPQCAAAGFELVHRNGFSEILTPKFRCHIVEGQFDLVAPDTGALVGSYDFSETFNSTEIVTLQLGFFKRCLSFPAPAVAETLFLCLLKPLNTTTAQDFSALLEVTPIEVDCFAQVCARSPEAEAIVKERLRLLGGHCHGRSREQVQSLVAALH